MHEPPRATIGRGGCIYHRQPRRRRQPHHHCLPPPWRGGARAQHDGGCDDRRRRRVCGGGQRRAGPAGTQVGWWLHWWRLRRVRPCHRRLRLTLPAGASPCGAPRLPVVSVAPLSSRVWLLSQSCDKVIQWNKKEPAANSGERISTSLLCYTTDHTRKMLQLLRMQQRQARTKPTRE